MHILHIDCSPRASSYSRQLSAAIVARLVAVHAQARVVRRDLGTHPIPHAEPSYAHALSNVDAMVEGIKSGATELSERLIQEIEAADALVIGTPMNNFTVPSVLKAWIDQVVRIGRSFASAGNGEKLGLLADRPVYVAIAAGGNFTGERAKQPDFLTPYLSAALGCIGLKTLHFLSLQGTAFINAEELAQTQDKLLSTLVM